MSNLSPKYVVRKMVGTDQYVVDALWSDGARQQLIGVYTSQMSAKRFAMSFRDSSPILSRTDDVTLKVQVKR